mmetsp:Transcript_49697/g.131090  ORF Transcript_49697/g.131090 Transcript_49697/m.131090 type:complete len:435 (-) Transcript_49697:33-1337(-)
MIIYDTRPFVGSLFHWQGTVLPDVIHNMLLVGIGSMVIFAAQVQFSWHLDVAGIHILGTIVGFLLIFRSSNAFKTYTESARIITAFTCATADVLTAGVCYLRGAENGDQVVTAKLRETKTMVARLLLGYCVLFKLHSRVAYSGYMLGAIDNDVKVQVDFDMLRLKGLLTEEHYKQVKRALGLTFDLAHQQQCGAELVWRVTQETMPRPALCLVAALRRCFLSMAGTPAGYAERVLQIADPQLTNLLNIYAAMVEQVSTPLPLPYCHLCRLLMVMFLLVYATHIDPVMGFVANVVIPVTVSLAMLGIDAIASEIEDPFGDDPNDFELMPVIRRMELEVLMAMQMGVAPEAANDFVWVPAPAQYDEVQEFLIHVSNLDRVNEQVMEGIARPARIDLSAMADFGCAQPLVSTGWGSARVVPTSPTACPRTSTAQWSA